MDEESGKEKVENLCLTTWERVAAIDSTNYYWYYPAERKWGVVPTQDVTYYYYEKCHIVRFKHIFSG